MDAPNYSDPNQVIRWMIEKSNQAEQIPYLTPELLKQMQGMLSPFFNAQKSAYQQQAGGALNKAVSGARNTARSEAAFRGYNPASYMQSAEAKTREAMSPSYFGGMANLDIEQLKTALGMTTGQQGFKAQQAWQGVGTMGNAGNLALMLKQIESQPDLLDYILGGLSGGVGNILGGLGAGWGMSLGGGSTSTGGGGGKF